jgi:hypothetical protein
MNLYKKEDKTSIAVALKKVWSLRFCSIKHCRIIT